MNIYIKTIDHKKQRYNTCGDWKFKENECAEEKLFIKISKIDNWKMEFLISIHEVIEAILCRSRGIDEKDVTVFDKVFTGKGEPGDNRLSPYRREHKFATKIEKLMAKELNVDWKKYEQAINMLQ